MELLTYDQLDQACLNVIDLSRFYYRKYYWYFKLLYLTGCRPAEPLHLSRWSFVNPSLIRFNPLKNNNPRFFDPDLLPNLFVDSVLSQEPLLQLHNLSAINTAFKLMNTPGKIYTTSDFTGLYVFRYRYVRSLVLASMTYEDIRLHMGWHSVTMAENYATKELFRK